MIDTPRPSRQSSSKTAFCQAEESGSGIWEKGGRHVNQNKENVVIVFTKRIATCNQYDYLFRKNTMKPKHDFDFAPRPTTRYFMNTSILYQKFIIQCIVVFLLCFDFGLIEIFVDSVVALFVASQHTLARSVCHQSHKIHFINKLICESWPKCSLFCK
jgi:hypothetical protein